MFSAVKKPHFFSQHDLRGLSSVQDLERRVEEEYLGQVFPGETQGDGSAATGPCPIFTRRSRWNRSCGCGRTRGSLSRCAIRSGRCAVALIGGCCYIGRCSSAQLPGCLGRHAASGRRPGAMPEESCARPALASLRRRAGRLATYVERLFADASGASGAWSWCSTMLKSPSRLRKGAEILDFFGLREGNRGTCTSQEAAVTVGLAAFARAWLQRLLKRPPKPLAQSWWGSQAFGYATHSRDA